MFAHLNALLQRDPLFDRLSIAVAFAKRSGVALVKQAMQAFTANGGSVEVIVGIDHKGTTKQGLEELLQVTPQVYVFHDNRLNCTFHPKLYLFERPSQEAVAFVGSSNLTAGGLYSNYEMNARFDLNLTVNDDAATFQTFSQVFQNLATLALQLDDALLSQLEQRNWLGDETPPTSAPQPATTPEETQVQPTPPSPFPTIHVPPAPPIPKPTPVVAPTVTPPAPAVTLPANAFLMTLQNTDISQKRAHSPDVFIPLEARNANPAFWGWSQQFQKVSGTKGSFDERYAAMCINRQNQPAVVRPVRLYAYAERHEFRLNCGEIREQATIDDILCIERAPAGMPYEYEITVIKQNDPLYPQFLNLCVNQITRGTSRKHWGYI